ncbi:MAG TPA: hypothetical protein VMN36_16575 [Verrucomicrobiales bacterium]|nr:hypothetical protein [Verrucomicrobiales bacterium]
MQTSLNTYAAARWDDEGQPELLSRAADTIAAVNAQAISANGSVVAGGAVNTTNGKSVAFRWTSRGGVTALPNPTTGFFAIDGATASGISGDGRVIVGYGQNVAGEEEAIFWVEGQPYRVSDVAHTAGVLPPSWEPFRAHATDYFGNTICGYGRATSGKLEAFVLILDATPPAPPVVAPAVRPFYTRSNGTFAIRYPALPGLRYRVRGESDLGSLAPLTPWSVGLGIEHEFLATPAVTGGASAFFLQVEAAAP